MIPVLSIGDHLCSIHFYLKHFALGEKDQPQRRRRFLVITCLSYHWYSHCNARLCREMLSIVIIYKHFFFLVMRI